MDSEKFKRETAHLRLHETEARPVQLAPKKIPRVFVVFERRFGVSRLGRILAHGGDSPGIVAPREPAVWV